MSQHPAHLAYKPKLPPDPYDVMDDYHVLVPRQYVDIEHDYSPQVNGEITRRIPFPRSLFSPAFKHRVKGSVGPCKRPPATRSYLRNATVNLTTGWAYRAIQDDWGDFRSAEGSDPRATVSLLDKSNTHYGYVYFYRCSLATMKVCYRDKSTKKLIGWCIPKKNLHPEELPIF